MIVTAARELVNTPDRADVIGAKRSLYLENEFEAR